MDVSCHLRMWSGMTDTTAQSDFEYRPWFRFGHRRVYVERGGVKLGYFDYEGRAPHPEAVDQLDPLIEAAASWVPKSEQRKVKATERSEPEPESPSPAPTDPAEAAEPVRQVAPAAHDVDLAANRAGEHPQAKADELGAEIGWFGRLVDRYLMRKTDYEAWRRGALGERHVGGILEKLGPQWRVLHGIPAGRRGADLDHLLIGPGGVFVVNTKNHARVSVAVYPGSVYAAGQRTDYLLKARAEAELASSRLGVPVHPVVCIIPDPESGYKEKGQPSDVTVVRSDRLKKWVEALFPTLSEQHVEEIYANARRSSTWTR